MRTLTLPCELGDGDCLMVQPGFLSETAVRVQVQEGEKRSFVLLDAGSARKLRDCLDDFLDGAEHDAVHDPARALRLIQPRGLRHS